MNLASHLCTRENLLLAIGRFDIREWSIALSKVVSREIWILLMGMKLKWSICGLKVLHEFRTSIGHVAWSNYACRQFCMRLRPRGNIVGPITMSQYQSGPILVMEGKKWNCCYGSHHYLGPTLVVRSSCFPTWTSNLFLPSLIFVTVFLVQVTGICICD